MLLRFTTQLEATLRLARLFLIISIVVLSTVIAHQEDDDYSPQKQKVDFVTSHIKRFLTTSEQQISGSDSLSPNKEKEKFVFAEHLPVRNLKDLTSHSIQSSRPLREEQAGEVQQSNSFHTTLWNRFLLPFSYNNEKQAKSTTASSTGTFTSPLAELKKSSSHSSASSSSEPALVISQASSISSLLESSLSYLSMTTSIQKRMSSRFDYDIMNNTCTECPTEDIPEADGEEDSDDPTSSHSAEKQHSSNRSFGDCCRANGTCCLLCCPAFTSCCVSETHRYYSCCTGSDVCGDGGECIKVVNTYLVPVLFVIVFLVILTLIAIGRFYIACMNCRNRNNPEAARLAGQGRDYATNSEGCSDEFIASLPVVVYNRGVLTRNMPICVVCLDDFVDGEELRMLPCQHYFHKQCIDKWLVNASTCPLCVRNIREMPAYQSVNGERPSIDSNPLSVNSESIEVDVFIPIPDGPSAVTESIE